MVLKLTISSKKKTTMAIRKLDFFCIPADISMCLDQHEKTTIVRDKIYNVFQK